MTKSIKVNYIPSASFVNYWWSSALRPGITGIAGWRSVQLVSSNTLCGFYGDKLVHLDDCRCDEAFDRGRDVSL
jgi:hypothetical protein